MTTQWTETQVESENVLANGITDRSGSGAPNFPQGVKISEDIELVLVGSNLVIRVRDSLGVFQNAIEITGDDQFVGLGVTPTQKIHIQRAGAIAALIESSIPLTNGQTHGLKIQASSAGNADFGLFKNSSLSNPTGYFALADANSTPRYFWVDNSGVFRTSTSIGLVGQNSGSIVGTQTSDKRLKENIKPTERGLETALKLNPVDFNFTYGDKKPRIGFLAQEVEKIIPEAVYRTGEDADGAVNSYAMDYEQLIGVLTKSIHDLAEQNKNLESRIVALASKLDK